MHLTQHGANEELGDVQQPVGSTTAAAANQAAGSQPEVYEAQQGPCPSCWPVLPAVLPCCWRQCRERVAFVAEMLEVLARAAGRTTALTVSEL